MSDNNVWSEELRPQKLDDIIGQPSVAVLKAFVRHKNVVDVNLSGPPGVGKTSAVIAMAKELYGTEPVRFGTSHFDANFKMLNASDERRIDDVRTTIKNFTTQSPTNPEVPFLIMYLDEADRIVNVAQDALRATIEEHSDNCRFILSCNNLSGLIEALQSRAPTIPFYRISDIDMHAITIKICQHKNLTITEDALNILISSCNGDMRNLTKKLQIASMLNPNITIETLSQFITHINDSATEKIISFVLSKDLENARSLLIELYATAHYDSEAILISLDKAISKVENQFPNKIAFYKTQTKLGRAFIDINQTRTPLYILINLLSDIILINQIPINCHYVKES